MKKLVSLLLAAVTAVSFASCAAPADDNPAPSDNAGVSETAGETTEKPYLDNLPQELDFDGRAIRFICSDMPSFESKEDAADVVDVEVYKRNRLIEDRLNINFEMTLDEGWDVVSGTLRTSVSAGSDDYELYGGYCYWSIALATDGYMTNLANAEYLDLDQPYWGKKFIDAMAYKDYIYWLTGDIALPYTNGIYATFVNLNQWGNKFSSEDLYGIVRDGKWTLDLLREHAVASYEDLNGDAKVDDSDFIGWVYTQEDAIDGMSMAAGVKYTEFDADGVPYIVITSGEGMDRAVSFSEKLTNLCQSSASLLKAADGGYAPFISFGNGSAMFIVGRIANSVTYLRDMKDDFAIVPAPKLDDTQSTYLTTLHDGTTILGIPKTSTGDAVSATCAALEALAAQSAKALTPVYLDVALKNKYTRDAESAEMIDLIRENVVSDFGFQYTSTGFNNFYRAQVKAGSGIASTIAKKEKSWNASLTKILEKLEANAG